LQWHDHRLRPDHRPQRLCRFRHLPGLDAEEDHIDFAHLRRIVRHSRGLDYDLARRGIKPQTCRANRLQMWTAGDEDHILAGMRELRAKVSADAASAEDRYAHLKIPA